MRTIESSLRTLHRLAASGLLSASAAHEIKNALVAIRTFTEVVSERAQASDAELAGLVAREIQRIESITGQFLNFTGPMGGSFAPLHLHEVLEDSLKLVGHKLASRDINLTRSLNAPTDLISGNEQKLRQALINLFLNAVEAMEPRGVLHIATEAWAESGQGQSRRICLSIHDTGPGISPQNLRRLFQPFFTTKPEGTGLGLAITRRIVEEHTGTIAVQSSSAKGTTFKIELPLAATQPGTGQRT